ncbi:MAG: hypothetical protein WC475_00660 [Candidatus Paceibacterota bacterium]
MNQKPEIKEDERGKFVEIFKAPGFGQVSYSTTKPGVVRGNHYHTRKLEKFCVIEGKAKISLRNRGTNEIKEYYVSGDKPEIVDMTLDWTHNIQNIGDTEMKLLIWTNEVFDPGDPDTYPEEV